MFSLPSANCIFYKFVENRMKTTALGGSIHIIYINWEYTINSISFMYGFRPEGMFPFLKDIASFLKVFFFIALLI